MSRRKALVVGVTGSLGAAVVHRLSRDGFDVVGIYRSNREKAESLQAEVQAAGGWFSPLQADVATPADATRAVEEGAGLLGGLDLLVNCQGAVNRMVPFLQDDAAAIERIIDVEFRSVVYCCKAAASIMAARGEGGSIITVGSDSGRGGASGEVVSSGTRAAVIGLSKAMALELGRKGIRVNVVCPGPIESELLSRMQQSPLGEKVIPALSKRIPLGRLGQPSDVAGAVAFLAGPDGAYLTGQSISVSGGLTMI